MFVKRKGSKMDTNKKELAERMYRNLDLISNGDFNFNEDYDDFVTAFEKTLYDYALVPIAAIIEQ
jgi:hypothetical protein